MSSVAAQHIPDKEAFLERRVAGSFRIGAVDTDGELSFWYCCPCGCGAVAPLLAGNVFLLDCLLAPWAQIYSELHSPH